MDDQRERISRLVRAASKLLILYEQELTAYHIVFREAQKQIPPKQFAFDFHFRKILRSPALAAEAETFYADLEPLLHPVSDADILGVLDRATSALERRLATYEK